MSARSVHVEQRDSRCKECKKPILNVPYCLTINSTVALNLVSHDRKDVVRKSTAIGDLQSCKPDVSAVHLLSKLHEKSQYLTCAELSPLTDSSSILFPFNG